MKRATVILLATLLALRLAGPFGLASVDAAVRVNRPPPKVVLIVGPAGAATASYRRLADEAAAAAAAYTPNVVRVYSPDATWPAVKQALAGASIVVYLGHGNGFPSPYHDSLFPSTQNGLGLNPNAGAADTHQYFGEDRIAKEIKLAKNAVVIFSHLCYASGNAEPGVAEGGLEVGQQRVDNYAAGFVKAGAAAVIAEAYMGPAYYVKGILAGQGSIDRIWRAAPTYHGNLLRFDSLRSPGFTAQMDPDTPTTGFHRSIVLRDGLATGSVLGGAVRTPSGSTGSLLPFEPTLAGLGVEFDSPALAAPPTVGTKTNLTFKVGASDPSVLPKGLMVGVRWDPLEPDVTTPAAPAPAPGPSASAAPDPIVLVSPEVLGEVVVPVPATAGAGGITVPVTVPTAPGLYRLVGTIHGSDGVAYDAATQDLMPALIVRVTGPLTAAYDAPSVAYETVGRSFQLPVRVTNLGSSPWGSARVTHAVGGAEVEPARRATIVARWIDLADGTGSAPAAEGRAVLPAGLAPGASSTVAFNLTPPTKAGNYLVLIDVLVPNAGSLAIAGVPPAIVRVTVSGVAVAPAP